MSYASSDNHRTFDENDLCDRDGPGAPAATLGYFNLGNMLIAELTNLEPGNIIFRFPLQLHYVFQTRSTTTGKLFDC